MDTVKAAPERWISTRRGSRFTSTTQTRCSARRSTTPTNAAKRIGNKRKSLIDAGERMIIGVPKEIKDHETRVGITPAGVKALTEAGHKVLVETHAGELSALTDDEYQSAGAEIVGAAGHVWGKADMVVKVKEPTDKEYVFFREGLVLFTYLHLAPVPDL